MRYAAYAALFVLLGCSEPVTEPERAPVETAVSDPKSLRNAATGVSRTPVAMDWSGVAVISGADGEYIVVGQVQRRKY